MGTPNRGPHEYNRNMIGIHLPGSSYSDISLTIYSWGSLFMVSSK